MGALIPELSGGATEHVEDLREWGRKGVAPVVANERFGRIRLTHVNLDDGTAEGFAFLDVPAFSVQYHPEAAPGPTDATTCSPPSRALWRAVRTTWTSTSRPTACPVGSSELTRKGRWRKCPSARISRAFSL